MKAIFFTDNNCYKSRFVNFVEDRRELSIFVDKNAYIRMIGNFTDVIKQHITIEPTIFKVFEVFCQDGSDIYLPGITSFISTRFADHGISIIYTNSFNNSYILVAEKDFTNACEILKRIAKLDTELESIDSEIIETE